MTNLSNPKPGHPTGGAGHDRGTAGRDVGGAQRSAKGTTSRFRPPGNHRRTSSKTFRKQEQKQSYPNRTEEPDGLLKGRLIAGLLAGPRLLFVPGCRPVDRCFFVFKSFACNGYLGRKNIAWLFEEKNLQIYDRQSILAKINNNIHPRRLCGTFFNLSASSGVGGAANYGGSRPIIQEIHTAAPPPLLAKGIPNNEWIRAIFQREKAALTLPPADDKFVSLSFSPAG